MDVKRHDNIVLVTMAGRADETSGSALAEAINASVDEVYTEHATCLLFVNATALENIDWGFSSAIARTVKRLSRDSFHLIGLTPYGWLLGFGMTVMKNFGINGHLATTTAEAIDTATDLGFPALAGLPLAAAPVEARCPVCRDLIALPCTRCSACGASIDWFSDAALAFNACPNVRYCPTFPLINNSGQLKNLISTYCTADFDTCSRKQQMEQGIRPDRKLLPDGTWLK